MSFEYSWEKETETTRWDRAPQDTVWDIPETLVDPLDEFIEYSKDMVAPWEQELEDEEVFLSLEENPDLEEWLMKNV